MAESIDIIEKVSSLAGDVLRLSRNTLLVNLRFLDRALNVFKLSTTDKTTLSTDGEHLYYNPVYVLQRYKKEKEAIVRDYLHVVMHCVFQHMFVGDLANRHCWDLACDIAVEYTITGLGIRSTAVAREVLMGKVFKGLKEESVTITAEKLYRYFLDKKLTELQIAELRGIFLSDDHEVWYMSDPEKYESFGTQSADGDSPNDNNGIEEENRDQETTNEEDSQEGASSTLSFEAQLSRIHPGKPDVEQEWEGISEQIQMDMETFSKTQGNDPGAMLQNLREVNREKYDYTEFLRKFAVMQEAMMVNDDEFDYIYYTYGLKLYNNVPLIEPLEYKEVKRIREFVIAIDTSRSTSGDLVQRFVQKTYNILKSTESFSSTVNIHIIQCDATIQEDAIIQNQAEVDEYLKHMKLHGFGGTDFRPVFSYVDWLREKKEFYNLKGLIYFTDGFGTFPSKKPDYETAFVFVDDGMNNYNVPTWAMKLVLQQEEI